MPDLHRIGYADKSAAAKITNWMQRPADPTLPPPLLIDCRHTPKTSYHPWDQEDLYRDYGERYRWAGKVFGNPDHHKKGAPIRLSDYPRGCKRIEEYLTLGHDLILLCGCANYFACHLQMIVEKLLMDLPHLLAPCLSISQPYAWLILHSELLIRCNVAPKLVENRKQDTQYRGGPLYLHTGKTPNPDDFGKGGALDLGWKRRVGDDLYALMPKFFREYETGGIVGKATLEQVVEYSREPWAVSGQKQYLLSSVESLPFTPCRGDLGIFALPASLVKSSLQVAR